MMNPQQAQACQTRKERWSAIASRNEKQIIVLLTLALLVGHFYVHDPDFGGYSDNMTWDKNLVYWLTVAVGIIIAAKVSPWEVSLVPYFASGAGWIADKVNPEHIETLTKRARKRRTQNARRAEHNEPNVNPFENASQTLPKNPERKQELKI